MGRCRLSKPSLRVVAADEPEHPRSIGRRLVKDYQQEPKDPVVNIHVPEENRPPSLNVDEVIKNSQPDLIGKK